MKPGSTPQWQHDRALTPRTASLKCVRELGIIDLELPIPGEQLVEILPFGAVEDEDGVEWVAVRVTIDWPGCTLTFEVGGWIERPALERLPRLRDLMLEAPADLSPLATLDQWALLRKPSRRKRPSMKLRLEVKPTDGAELLQAWLGGRRPVLRTLAFLERAVLETSEAESEVVSQALHHLSNRELGRCEREGIVSALRRAVAAVGDWAQWPIYPSIDEFDPFGEDLRGTFDPDEPFFDEGFDDFD